MLLRKDYNPNDYWERRLSGRFNLSKVGCLGFSEYYNKFLYKAKIRALKKALLFQHVSIGGKTICDIGCGTGFFVSFYHLQGAIDIVGVDITTVSIENLRAKYPKYHFIQGDISSPFLASTINRKFDILNVFDVLYHVTDDEAFGLAIVNICSLTQDDGFILLTDLFSSKSFNVAAHVKFRSKQIYQTALGENGAEVIGIYPLYYVLNRPIFGKFRQALLRKIGLMMDNVYAPIYYYLGRILLSPRRSNLNLIVAKKKKMKK